MILVIETAPNVRPDTEPDIRRSLEAFGLNVLSEPFISGSHAFYYYTAKDNSDTGSIVESVRRLPGVRAAYLKPEGAPPG
jgi:hypothetical protein